MRILHVFRSPIGGLFRHVCDLSLEQQASGFDVGIVCDSSEKNAAIDATLDTLHRSLKLGVHRLPISRLPHPKDISAIRTVAQFADTYKINLLHGHGAKGGLIARLAHHPSVYTPHGGSLHYAWHSPAGAAFLFAEKMLARKTAGFSFVCAFEKRAFEDKIGTANKPTCVVHNGLQSDEFQPVDLAPNATDLLFVGEMRKLKGVDVLLDALALQKHPALTATLVGDGPDLELFKHQATQLGLNKRVNFPGRLSMRQALSHGRILVLPSRNESFPYVLLEALAAGRKVIATDVGGISEILDQKYLVKPDDPKALADKISSSDQMAFPNFVHQDLTVKAMAGQIAKFYDKILMHH
jgi:glycosyltransferase involved in cell wall biosynthesis